MVEVAWNYCQLVLGSTLQRGMIEQTLPALAIEMVLKSYNSVVVDNVGEINEMYQFQVPSGTKLSNMVRVQPEHLLNRSANGVPPVPVRSYKVYFRHTTWYHTVAA